MSNSWQQISGTAAVNNSTKAATLLASATGKRVRAISIHIYVTAAATGGTPIITLRDGTGGTILWQQPGDKAAQPYDLDFHDEIGFPMTVGNPLSLEVSGGNTDASVGALATGFLI